MAHVSQHPTGAIGGVSVAAGGTPVTVPQAPGAWPVLGHIVAMLRRPLEFLPALAEHGGVVMVRFGRLPVYVVAQPDAVRDLLVPGDVDFKRGLCFEKLEPWSRCGHRDGLRCRAPPAARAAPARLQP